MHPLNLRDLPSPECVSELELDELRAGELSAQDAQRCRAHLAQCHACSQKLQLIERADAQLLAAAPSFHALRARVAPAAVVSARPARGRPQRQMRALTAPLAGLALAALALLALRPGAELPGAGETRAKGEPRLGVYVKHGESVRRAENGDRVQPADALRFVYTSDRPYFFALFSRAARTVSSYFPDGARAVELPAGQEAALDFSVELDDSPGPEHVIGLFCPQAFDLELARGALASSQPLPATLAGCHRAALELNKQSGP